MRYLYYYAHTYMSERDFAIVMPSRIQGYKSITQGRTGGVPPKFDLRMWMLRADNWLLRTLSCQPPRSYFCSATTGITYMLSVLFL